jgi:putative FmdB family regulatory protein
MPLYEFICGNCEKDFESLVRSANWEGAVTCPHCGSKKLTKQLSVFAAQGGGSTSASAPAPQACCRPGGCGCVGGRHHH